MLDEKGIFLQQQRLERADRGRIHHPDIAGGGPKMLLALRRRLLVEPMPNLFSSLDNAAACSRIEAVPTPTEAAVRHRSWSKRIASRVSVPWSLIENRTRCRRKDASVVGA